MKKTFLLAAVATICTVSLISCANIAPAGEPEGSAPTRHEPYVGALKNAVYTSPMDYSDQYITEHRRESPIDPKNYPTYAKTYAESVSASEDYRAAWEHFTDVRYYPIYGTYLEYTDLFYVAFYENGGIQSAFLLTAAEKEGSLSVSEFDSGYFDGSPNGQNGTFVDDMRRTLECCPEFSVEGAILNYYSCVMIPPIGRVSEDAPMQRYLVCPEGVGDFEDVKPFYTVEEGQNAYREFGRQMDEVYRSVPLFDPERVSSIVWWGEKYSCDYEIAFRLDGCSADEDYALHLLYDDDRLIGEVILPRHGFLSPIYEKLADRTVDPAACLTVADSLYLSGIQKSAEYTDMAIDRVLFDGTNIITYGTSPSGEKIAYNCGENSFLTGFVPPE